MPYDISDDDLPQTVKDGLKGRGWRFDASAQEWRKYNGEDQHFSPVPGDHARQFANDVEAILRTPEPPAEDADNMSSTQVQNFVGDAQPSSENDGA